MTTPRKSKVITFSMPPDMAAEVQRIVQEEDRTMSEFLRDAIRLYIDEREWRVKERMQRRRSRRTAQNQPDEV